MKRPIRVSALAALLLQGFTVGMGGRGTLATIAELLAVYFALDFAMLLALSLFSNRAWRLTPALHWAER